ncbi:hypothetical protein CBR_g1128 [Chara braunii]|uniref:Uncharacterized protein n=1 Tax=Chara braunii TaxID=69332 RepID=A0A388KD66_CHABU|nr:hypothetical protein CBR_g1128 [Chara braunii]|eukprot:GBG68008.1 hypothetical protein CBR_g1128 [Chara braunii]
MRIVSRMGAMRRVEESDRRRRRGGGRAHGGHWRSGVGGTRRGGGDDVSWSRRQRAGVFIHKARERWDEGDFLFDSSSSDGDDFFALGTPARTDDERRDGDDRGDGRRGGDRGGGGGGGGAGGGGEDPHNGVDQCEHDGPAPGWPVVLQRLRRGARPDNNIASRVRKRHLRPQHDAIVTEAHVVQHEQVVVSEDSMSDKDFVPSDADMGGTEDQPDLVEAPTTSVTAMLAPEKSGQGFTRPKSTTHIGSENGEVERGAHGGTGVAVPSIGEAVHPPTVDVGLEDGEVVRTPTCAYEGEDAHHATVDLVGLACPTGSLPPTAVLLAMHSALDRLRDMSTLMSSTLPFVAPPATGPADDTNVVCRGFDEFVGDTILHPGVSASPAVFHMGAPHAVDQGLAEQVARNRYGGPRIAAQRSLGDSFERVDAECEAQEGLCAQDFAGDGSSF